MVHPVTGKPRRTVTYVGDEECAAPRALELAEIPRLIEDYKRAYAITKPARTFFYLHFPFISFYYCEHFISLSLSLSLYIYKRERDRERQRERAIYLYK